MARSFDLVDFKVAEAEFFLRRIPKCGPNFFAVQCYVSAFIASTRSITFALQSCIKDLKGFSDWYKAHQEKLKNDSLSRFFHDFRRINQHIGENVVRSGTMISGKYKYWFTPVPDLNSVPDKDVETACREYFVTILSIAYECYVDFGSYIDPKQYYTPVHFARFGKTIEDAEEEIFGIRGWTKLPGYPEDYRWQALRDSQPGCGINHIFLDYLGKTIPEPKRLPDLPSPESEACAERNQEKSAISDTLGECSSHFLKTAAAKKNKDQ